MHLAPSETSLKKDLFVKIIDSFQPWTIFTKSCVRCLTGFWMCFPVVWKFRFVSSEMQPLRKKYKFKSKKAVNIPETTKLDMKINWCVLSFCCSSTLVILLLCKLVLYELFCWSIVIYISMWWLEAVARRCSVKKVFLKI